jgi:hypothetical protein
LLTHTSVRAANDYLIERGVDNATRLNAGRSDSYVERVLTASAVYLHAIAADWCELLQVPSAMRDELREVEGEWPKLPASHERGQ